MNDVLITGLGVVSPIGDTIERYWSGLLAGSSRPRRYPWIDEHAVPNPVTYWIDEPKRPVVSDAGLGFGRASQFAVRAASMALADAGLDDECRTAVGVAIGTGMGHADLLEDERDGTGAPAPLDRFTFEVASTVAGELRLNGPNMSVSTACAAGAYSVSLGVDAIRDGCADVIVAGGAEGFSRIALGCFHRLGALDPVVCRPFDVDRAGTVFGEGAAMLVLESAEHARRRSATVYGSISGCGWSCDAHHATAPEPDGQQTIAAVRRALAEAELEPADIDCAIPHGTGTDLNDVVESAMLAQVFGERVKQLRIFALKSVIGHTGGAAGAFSCLTAALILDRGLVPPTANLTSADPRCPLHLHTGAPIAGDIRHALVNAYAFGGNNISLILDKADVP
jgi:3-oxoacyl-[acyl-carrier-protein] synthase II